MSCSERVWWCSIFLPENNEDLQIGGLDVQAEELIDMIDGYKGQGYGKSTEEELGRCLFK